MKCKYCNTINEEDAVFCKKCGNSLYPVEEEKKNKKEQKKSKTKKKIKKVKQKVTKVKKQKEKKSTGQKVLIFIMTLILLILLGILGVVGYYYYQEQNIEVPNVIGLTYDEAITKLADKNLKAEKKEIEVEDVNDEGIVLKQNKKSGKKVGKNTKIKVTVGILKQYTLPNLVGKDIEDVKKLLDKNQIKYKIVYEEDEEENNQIVTSQIPDKEVKITINDIVTIVVNQKIENSQENSTSEKEEEQNSVENHEEDVVEE